MLEVVSSKFPQDDNAFGLVRPTAQQWLAYREWYRDSGVIEEDDVQEDSDNLYYILTSRIAKGLEALPAANVPNG